MKKKKKPVRQIEKSEPLYVQILEFFRSLIWAFGLFLMVSSQLLQAYKIPTPSMENTLLVGDFLFGLKSYWKFFEPEAGDIVIFQYPYKPEYPPLANSAQEYDPLPGNFNKGDTVRYDKIIGNIYWDNQEDFLKWHGKEEWVKRCVAIEGDTVEVKNKILFVNGRQKDYKVGSQYYYKPNEDKEVKIEHRDWRPNYFNIRDNFGPYVVGSDSIFVMGDNRDNSKDSRFWGALDKKYLVATPLIRHFSLGDNGIRFERILNTVK